jgi:putative thioredoxin
MDAAMSAATTTSVRLIDNYVGGQWTPASGTDELDVTNPATGEVLARVPMSSSSDLDAAVAAARAALDLVEQAKSVGPIAELEQKVAANPLDHQARFDLAVALNGKGKRQEAVDHLLDIVKRDRKWNDDGARKQLVQFFEAWGPADEATVNGRKRLSSVLFA